MLQGSLPPAKDADLEVEGKAGADDDGLPKTATTAEGAPIDASFSAMRIGGERDGAGVEKGEQEEEDEEVGAVDQGAGGVPAAVGLLASATVGAEEQHEERAREAAAVLSFSNKGAAGGGVGPKPSGGGFGFSKGAAGGGGGGGGGGGVRHLVVRARVEPSPASGEEAVWTEWHALQPGRPIELRMPADTGEEAAAVQQTSVQTDKTAAVVGPDSPLKYGGGASAGGVAVAASPFGLPSTRQLYQPQAAAPLVEALTAVAPRVDSLLVDGAAAAPLPLVENLAAPPAANTGKDFLASLDGPAQPVQAPPSIPQEQQQPPAPATPPPTETGAWDAETVSARSREAREMSARIMGNLLQSQSVAA